MKALGIDLGGRRVGVAVTAGVGGVVVPLATLSRERKDSDRIRRLIRLGEQHHVDCFVMGLPLQMDGTEGEAAEKARQFAERLAARSGKPVELVDERLTTVEAEEAMIAAGATRDRRRELIDQMSAVIILQGWLARQARG